MATGGSGIMLLFELLPLDCTVCPVFGVKLFGSPPIGRLGGQLMVVTSLESRKG